MLGWAVLAVQKRLVATVKCFPPESDCAAMELSTAHVLVCAAGRSEDRRALARCRQKGCSRPGPGEGRKWKKTCCPWGFVFLHMEIIAGMDMKFKHWEGTGWARSEGGSADPAWLTPGRECF